MIPDYSQKLAEFLNYIRRKGFLVEEIVNTQGDNPSRRFDIESNKSLGRIVVWSSCEWELETISIETGELTFWKSLNLPDDHELTKTLAIWESHMLT